MIEVSCSFDLSITMFIMGDGECNAFPPVGKGVGTLLIFFVVVEDSVFANGT